MSRAMLSGQFEALYMRNFANDTEIGRMLRSCDKFLSAEKYCSI